MIGLRLLPLLAERGHEVAGMTRTPAKAEALRRLGALPVVCDVFDRPALRDAVLDFAPLATGVMCRSARPRLKPLTKSRSSCMPLRLSPRTILYAPCSIALTKRPGKAQLSARKASLHQRQAGAVKSKAAHQQRLNKLAQSKPR